MTFPTSFSLTCFVFALPFLAFAQNAELKLQILNEQAEPLAFANVVELGTLNGTISDVEGRASLKLLNPASGKVQVSFIGYITIVLDPKDFPDEGQMTVKMEPDEIELAELEVIDLGADPKVILLEALQLFYRNSKRPRNFPNYRYMEDLTEIVNGEANKVELAALIIKSRGKVNRSNGAYAGKQKDSHFLVQSLFKDGESMYDTKKDPIAKGIIQFNKWDKEVDDESDLLFTRFENSLHFMENLIYRESVLSSLDWKVSKLQKSEDETLALFEHRQSIENSFYDKIFLSILVDLETRQIKTISLYTDRDIQWEPLGRDVPEFKDQLEFENWKKEYAKERNIHLSSLFLGKGQTIIHYHYDNSGTPLPKNIYLRSQLFHLSLDGDFDIQLEARMDLAEILSEKNVNLNNYLSLDFLVKWPEKE